ncbi:hypothetical protein ALO78_102699 [Pseudomonas amygdali pv. ciccaronei]|nr:hypothetical protein ALO78_102699 [Pseudomonas amygdali pv. ciccaronei]
MPASGRHARCVSGCAPHSPDAGCKNHSSAAAAIWSRRWAARPGAACRLLPCAQWFAGLHSSWASSACTWRLTALWVKASSSAALVKLPCRAAASKASNKDMEGVSLLVFIHKTHGKTASFTFALKHDTPENHDNR